MSSCDSKEERDCISELPNTIITHIFSLLSTKEAFVTSILSRKWMNQWQYCSTLLHFDYDKYYISEWGLKHEDIIMEESLKFILEVNQVLKSHKAPTIEEFRISLELDKKSKNVIDGLIKFALKRKVQRLELHLTRHEWDVWHYNEPYCLELLSGPSGPQNNVSTYEELKSLRWLSLKGVNVSGEVVEKILASCPVLDRLIIHRSRSLERLKVSGPSLMLKYLNICWCYRFRYLEMSNLRNLIGFKYVGNGINFCMKNVPKLTELSIGVPCTDKFISKFSCFSMLASLELTEAVYSTAKEFNFNPPELPNLRRFTLNVVWSFHGFDECLLGYTRLMKVAPLLESFVLRESWMGLWLYKASRRRSLMKVGENNWGRHERLEVVEFDGYCGNKCEEELVWYFIESACTSLKRIIVRPRDPSELKGLQERRFDKRKANNHARKHLSRIIPPHIDFIIVQD